MNRKEFLRLCGIAMPFSLMGIPTNMLSAPKSPKKKKFSFAFFTDVHLNTENRGHCNEGLQKALADAKKRNVDFILFGGDNVETDHLGQENEQTANNLHARFRKIIDESGTTCHFTIGNHDRYYFCEGEKDATGYKLFEKYFGKSQHSFDHKGVHFIALNSLNPDPNGQFCIGSEQMEWLKNDLNSIGKERPIVVSLHVPMLSLYYPVVEGNFKGLDMVTDTKAVFELLKAYNLKLILQGHQHIHEEILERNHQFITGGAISANWWNGSLADTEEGYILVHVDADYNFSWEYIDYQWEAIK